MSEIANAVDMHVADRAEKLADANPSRSEMNIRAGTTDIWYGGNNSVVAGTLGRKIMAGTQARLKGNAAKSEIWGIRAAGDAGMCSIEEDFE